jgi:hypothetical protein
MAAPWARMFWRLYVPRFWIKETLSPGNIPACLHSSAGSPAWNGLIETWDVGQKYISHDLQDYQDLQDLRIFIG